MTEEAKWTIINEQNKSLPVYERLGPEEARGFKERIAEWSNLNLACQELLAKDPVKNELQIKDIVENMERIDRETTRLGTLVLRRCMKLSQEEIIAMAQPEFRSWLHALVDSSLGPEEYHAPR